MNHGQVLKRAWQILWRYRALWIFGILLALTTPNGGSNSRWTTSGSDATAMSLPPQIQRALEGLNQGLSQLPEFNERSFVGIAIAILCVALLLGVLFTIARYVSRVALIRMVDNYETTGVKVGFRGGFRMGWSRAAWRLFLIDLVVFGPIFAAFLVLFGCAALPVLLSSAGGNDPGVPGVIATIGLAFLVIFVLVVIVVVISLLMEVVRRVCVLEGEGVFASIRRGWQIVRGHFKDVGLLWLILLGIRIGLGIVLIPVALFLVFSGIVAGGGLGYGLYSLLQGMAGLTPAVVAAVIVGLLIFFLLLAAPLLFINGLTETYFSTAWTLGYRDVRPVNGLVETAPEGGDLAEAVE